MVNITNVKVYDLFESMIASGYAMQTEFNPATLGKEAKRLEVEYSYGNEERIIKASQHVRRMVRLVQASKKSDVKCHDNALTGIRVSFDIVYPNYLSPELQRYHWVDIVTSASKMHRLVSMDLDKCCNKYVTPEMKKYLSDYISEYNAVKDPDEKYKAFMKVISNCPMGLELFMRVSTNYKQLQTIYMQRKDHKLKEDWGEFCKFVEGLPFARYLILGEDVPE